jgi:hypothetical protein
VGEHLDWLEKLQCGWGLIDQESYRVPTMSLPDAPDLLANKKPASQRGFFVVAGFGAR